MEAFRLRGHTCLILSIECVTFDHSLIVKCKLSMKCIQDLYLSEAHRQAHVGGNNMYSLNKASTDELLKILFSELSPL